MEWFGARSRSALAHELIGLTAEPAPVLLPGAARFEFGERCRLVEGADAADYR